MTAAPAPRLEALTGLRGLAAWYVVFYHIRLTLTDLLPAPVVAALAKGYLAVDLFFMLSGFVLWLNHGARFARPDAALVGRFWWRRIARIWPLHAVVLAGFCGFVALLVLTGRDRSGYPLHELPLHLLLVQNWGFTPQLTWNHPAWSISAELAAYLLFPLVAWLTRRDWSPAALLGWLAVLLAALHALFAAGGHRILGADIVHLGLPRCLIEFTAGTFAARLWLHWQGHPAASRFAWLGTLGAAVTGLAEYARPLDVDVVIAAEARGFLLGTALAREIGAGFVLARKPGKLPYDTISAEYDLEYGTDTLELHSDAVADGARVLVHDDLLATGGTARALVSLVEQLGGVVVGCGFLVELGFLDGRSRLAGHDVHALLRYDSE